MKMIMRFRGQKGEEAGDDDAFNLVLRIFQRGRGR
jgi:hypothetical protein